MARLKIIAFISLAFALILVDSNRTSGQASSDSVYAFKNVHLIPMDEERVIPNQTVIVQGTRITEIGGADTVTIPGQAVVIDGSGKYLMPGLAEMHGHIPPPDLPSSYPDSYIEDVLFLYLSGGITTVRGMLGHDGQLELKRKINEGKLQGPSLYLAGPSFNGNSVSSPKQASRRVRQQVEEGWYLLKIHPGLSSDEFDAIANTAHEDIPFGGHIPEDVGLMNALDMNIQTIDHLDGYIRYLDAADKPMDQKKLDEAVQASKEAETWVVPTMALWETLLGAADYDKMRTYPELKYMPEAVLNQWDEALRQFENRGKDQENEVQQHAENRLRLLKGLHDGGVPVLMGTDSPQVYSVPGFSLLRELEKMKEAGLSNYEILRTGTYNVGKYFEDADEIGTIAVGKRADLLLLDGNPLEDLSYLQGFPGIMVRGQWIPKKKIDEKLQEIASSYAVSGQSNSMKHDFGTVDAIIKALYESISGEKGEERDWETFRKLFMDGAKLIPAGMNQQGEVGARYWTPEQYIERSGPWLVNNGFFEEEIHREVDRFDPIAHVFSTYTSQNTKDGEIIARGINSIQLLNDGNRWWVVNIYWVGESEGREIPEKYDN